MRATAVAAALGATLAAGIAAPAGLTAGGQARPAAPAQTPFPSPPGQGQSAKGTGLIVGQVLDGTTGKPVGGALVTLTMTVTTTRPQGAAPQGLSSTTMTVSDGRGGVSSSTDVIVSSSSTGRVLADGEGRFMFHDLPAGNANLTATAPGYNSGSYGATRPNDPSRSIRLAEGERMSTAAVRLWRLCTIAGTITDEAGEPLVNVQVSALRFSTTNGTRRTEGGPQAQTDDRGAYHFLLQAGDYLLVVPATSTSVPMSSIDLFQQSMTNPVALTDFMRALSESGAPGINVSNGYRVGNTEFSTSGSMSRNSPPPKPDGPLLVYQTTYFPNATNPSQAETISLAPGEDRLNADLSMRLATTVRVTGALVSPDGNGSNLGVKLVAADSKDAQFNSNYPAANTASDATGAFTFLGVPPGQYELQVTRIARPQVMAGPNGTTTTVTPNTPTLWARVPVSVGTTDVSGLLVSLRTGLKISGRVEFDGGSPTPTADRLAALRIMINDIDGNGQVFPATVGSDRTFTTQGLVPGRLLALFQGSPGPKWVLKSVMANDHDISAGPQQIDGDVTNAVVTFTDHPNELSGTVQGLTSAAPAPAVGPNVNPVIVVFPANYQAWLAGGINGRQSRTIRIGQTAQFSTTALPAGEYDVAAIPAELVNGWQDPKTLELIARGATHVVMTDDGKQTIDLRPLTIR